jgi:hypothetical protein
MNFDDIYGAMDQQVSMEDLERLATNISLEAALGGLQQRTAPRVMQFFRSASGFFTKIKFTAINVAGLTARDLNGYVGAVGYVNASNKNVIVPESFTGQWVPYSAALKEAMTKAIQIEGMILSFNQALGRIINDPAALTSLSGIGYTGPRSLGLTADMVAIGKTYFDPRSNHITRALGSVIERPVDIDTTVANVNAAASLDKAHPPAKALKAVSRTMEMADTLMATVKLLTENKSLSHQEVLDVALQELVDLTLSIAKEMESYGTLLYRIRQFSEALKDSLKEIKK